MLETLLGIALGLVVGAALAFGAVWAWRRFKPTRQPPAIDVRSSVTRLRDVGELVVFRMTSQQIVTAEDHPAGRFREFVGWLISSKKMALVIEYGIDFKYDLRDPRMRIEGDGAGGVRLTLPPLEFQPHVRDIQFFDERNARWLPFLLGDITQALGPRFGEADKNKLLAAARAQAEKLAVAQASNLRNEVRESARRTLEALARGLGASAVEIDFEEGERAVLEAPTTRAAALPPSG